MTETIWRTKKGIREGGRVYTPGEIYDGAQLKNLGPKHPWVKAGWLEAETPKSESDAE